MFATGVLKGMSGFRYYSIPDVSSPVPSVTSVISVLDKPGKNFIPLFHFFFFLKRLIKLNYYKMKGISLWEKGIALESFKSQLEKECPISEDISTYLNTIHNPKWLEMVVMGAKQKPKIELERAADVGTHAHTCSFFLLFF